jgi:hypothetical protein
MGARQLTVATGNPGQLPLWITRASVPVPPADQAEAGVQQRSTATAATVIVQSRPLPMLRSTERPSLTQVRAVRIEVVNRLRDASVASDCYECDGGRD